MGNAADTVPSDCVIYSQQEYASAVTAMGTLDVPPAPALEEHRAPSDKAGAVSAPHHVPMAPSHFPTAVTSSYPKVTPPLLLPSDS